MRRLRVQGREPNQQLPILPLRGLVNARQWEEALTLYENNQGYYQDRKETGDLSEEALRAGLTQLEHWFLLIVEPRPKDKEEVPAWQVRERHKQEKGITAFCDLSLVPYLTPAPIEYRQWLTQFPCQ
jgi:hypothetical protein